MIMDECKNGDFFYQSINQLIQFISVRKQTMEGEKNVNQVQGDNNSINNKQAQTANNMQQVQEKNPATKREQENQPATKREQAGDEKPANQKQPTYQKNKKINKKKKKEQQIVYKNLNPFKQLQKHFKLYQDRQTDFSLLFDLSHASTLQIDGHTVYSLPTPEAGAYIIKGFSSPQTVNLIGYLGLNEFWKKPYRTNLDSRNQLYQDKAATSKTEDNKVESNADQIIELKSEASLSANTLARVEAKLLQNVQTKGQSIEKQQTTEEFLRQVQQKGYSFNDKIRWANVGHQYDWTLRKYPEYHTPMHAVIKELTDRANAIYNQIQKIDRSYYPESAIVNYYGVKDYMTGHLDDAEYDQVSPIYSFSFGLSCVFLMGSMNKDVKPLAIRLDSGDLMIMARNSRKCYHGVPRVIAGSYTPFEHKFSQENIPKNVNSPTQVETYFQRHRININIRQVFPEHN